MESARTVPLKKPNQTSLPQDDPLPLRPAREQEVARAKKTYRYDRSIAGLLFAEEVPNKDKGGLEYWAKPLYTLYRWTFSCCSGLGIRCCDDLAKNRRTEFFELHRATSCGDIS